MVQKRWTTQELKLLGTKPDVELAGQLGRTIWAVDKDVASHLHRTMGAVHNRRFELGIARCHITRPWTPEEDKLLGTARLGRHPTLVKRRRNAMGIAPFRRKLWTPVDEALLGKLPDRDVAKRTGHSLLAACSHRRLLGIANSNPLRILRPWSKEEMGLLGADTDKNVAKRLGRARDAVTAKRRSLGIPAMMPPAWTPEEEALLGTGPDKEIALKLAISAAAVAWRRHKFGIKSFAYRLWSAAEIKQLGTMPDAQVALRIGRSAGTVKGKRLKLGITAHTLVKHEGRKIATSLG